MDSTRLQAWFGQHICITGMAQLSGGAIQQNWALDVTRNGASEAWVLRTDNAATLPESLTRAQEFALLQAAQAAGVTVAEPLMLCEDAAIIGAPFFVMRRAAGQASGHANAKRAAAAGGDAALAAAHGRELARVHRTAPPAFLGAAPAAPMAAFIAEMRLRIDALGHPRPQLEWALRFLETRPPPPHQPVLCHRDFRTGNVMIADGRITAVLDWEFAAWGDPHEDLGWFTARCWRFGQDALEAGGIGSLDHFLAGYAAEAGWQPQPFTVRIWQLAATIRWAVIAAGQAARHLSGREPSLELALTGHMVPELEFDALNITERLRAGTA
ncbi:MAG: phosphotransferase family protein [Alphaproteobacteria bacterium]|nr:phosphotransferase family protein [Alphaproteobacteria bacterium]